MRKITEKISDWHDDLTEHCLEYVVCLVIAYLLVCFGIALGSYYQKQYYLPQITGLRAQLSRTQKQLKRASEDRARQTKRIAELTGNGG
ncbi:hypothetical protein BKX95_03790 [Streptococcus iniae]|nr:hypothetical protein BKX95_03790 [Streptococcus iniae]